jgi:hypothetical protein
MDLLADFYSRLLGLKEAFATPDRGVVALARAGPMLTLMRVDQYVAPSWPERPQHQQLHLDIAVEEIGLARTPRLLEEGKSFLIRAVPPLDCDCSGGTPGSALIGRALLHGGISIASAP